MTWRIIGNQRARGVAWAASRFPHTPEGEGWDQASALILERNGDITATVLYNNFWPGNSVEASIALERGSGLNRAFLRAMFAAPFIEWGLRRVTLKIASDNDRSIRFAKHLGFVPEGVIREAAAPGIDLLIFGMLRHECRFLGPEYEQRLTSGRTRSAENSGGANAIQYSDLDGERKSKSYQPIYAVR